jgi:hypothetical protein
VEARSADAELAKMRAAESETNGLSGHVTVDDHSELEGYFALFNTARIEQFSDKLHANHTVFRQNSPWRQLNQHEIRQALPALALVRPDRLKGRQCCPDRVLCLGEG